MNKDQIAEWAEIKTEGTIDCAVPWEWQKEANRLQIDGGGGFVWFYPHKEESQVPVVNSTFGRPMALSELFVKAINKGNLVPINTVRVAMERARENPDESLEDILELVKINCQYL